MREAGGEELARKRRESDRATLQQGRQILDELARKRRESDRATLQQGRQILDGATQPGPRVCPPHRDHPAAACLSLSASPPSPTYVAESSVYMRPHSHEA